MPITNKGITITNKTYKLPNAKHMFIKRKIHLIVKFCLLLLSVHAQPQEEKSKFRIVGYYSLKSAMEVDLKKVPFDRLTHINLYFLNPDTVGNFNQDFTAIIPFIKAAHRNNVKVIPSIAGGGQHTYYHDLLKDDKRAKFINDLLQIALKYDFDGIDVDIEGSDIDENYETFAVELAGVLKTHNKLITAAIAVFYKDVLSDKALEQYDFVNIMSYDHTGPWAPGKPGPHSTYDQAVKDLDYFGTVRKIPKEKMVLGVPFYGYGFGPTLTSPPISLNYGQIMDQFPEAGFTDSIVMPAGAIMYYNGIGTIKKKTALAKEKASGIMIWQVLGDAPGDKSLLKAINDEIL
ncbi:MAG: glycosyl hydrolase family 18 protein [Ginsengibacter sp.]